MNIFYFNKSAEQCAKDHCDKHVVKMIIEYIQLLSTAHRVLDGKMDTVKHNGRNKKMWLLDELKDECLFYLATHINHPSAKWARNSKANYDWLVQLTKCLLDEYTVRYGKTHACERFFPRLLIAPKNIPSGEFSPPWRAMPDEYKVVKSDPNYCELSYRNYFIGSKRHIAKWKTVTPDWYI